jgi:hypothetical protein
MSNSKMSDIDARFARRWTRATFAGWMLGFVLMLALIGVTGLVALGDRQFPIGLGMGAGVGLLQGRLIARHAGRRRDWLAASSVGMTLPFVAFDLADVVGWDVVYSLPIAVVAGGLVTGILEWRILREFYRNATSWIAASALGWSLAGSTVIVNEQFLPKIPGWVGALLYVAVVLVGGILLGAIGGLSLQRILRPVAGTTSGDAVRA